jgi:Mg2+ and Co2+ transporter CorA
MYFLTMVTTVFIPGQFLSGVYGMNFEVRFPFWSDPYAC